MGERLDRLVVAILLCLAVILSGFIVNVSSIDTAVSPGLYESSFSGNITSFKAENYNLPLYITINDNEKIKVIGELANVNTTTVKITDLPNGTYTYSNVVSLSISFYQECTYFKKDDDITITITNGESTIEVLIDQGTNTEYFSPGAVDNYYDSLVIKVDGKTVYSRSDIPISFDYFKSVVDKSGKKYLSMMIRYYLAGSWGYNSILLELPGLWNVTIYRKGYTVDPSYTPYWLPDLSITYVNSTITYNIEYYTYENGSWSIKYNHTGLPYPIVYDGANVFINTTTPVNLFSNISISSIWANQPIWIEYLTENGTTNSTTYSGCKDKLDISVHVDKLEKTLDGKYHYVLRVVIPYNSSLVLRLYTKGKIKIEGFGEYEDFAELLLSYNASLSNRGLNYGLGIPIVYAADNGITLDITSDDILNATIVKVITDTGEYVINQTITLGGKAISYIQSLWNRYNLLLIAVPVFFILLFLALAGKRR